MARDTSRAVGLNMTIIERWDSYTRKRDNTHQPAGSRPTLYVYDPAESDGSLVGPITVPQALRDEYAKVPRLANVEVTYSVYAQGRGEMSRTLVGIKVLQPASK